MGHFLFFLFAVVAGLLWTAACTAAAARVRRGWLEPLLAAVGAGLPVMAVLPIVAATWWLAFGVRLSANWFPQAVTVLIALVIGGGWIVRSGLTPRADGGRPAARWPVGGLTALCAIAAAVTAGVLLILDNAVQAQAPYLRLEAANLMQANLPPTVADADNAAPLHIQAAAAIAADKEFGAGDSPAETETVQHDEATAQLARHAGTLDLIRRAADRDRCRFTRDWSRPSIDMLLPEVQDMRNQARLLALAARRAAAEGRHADALADIVRLQRLGRHAAAEPILISYLVGLALDRLALVELADLLPRLGDGDAALLDVPGVRDLVDRRIDLLPALYGEEAFGLATFADFTDGRMTSEGIFTPEAATAPWPACDTGPIFRVFFLSDDIAGYRRLMHGAQQLAARRDAPADVIRQADNLEATALEKRSGILSRILVPTLRHVLQARARDEAAHRAAAVLVAATKQRLATGVLPLEPTAFTGPALFSMPADPFAEGNRPLLMKRSDAGLAVYSVGPDGADDDGPPPRGTDAEEGNDDVGLVMAVR